MLWLLEDVLHGRCPEESQLGLLAIRSANAAPFFVDFFHDRIIRKHAECATPIFLGNDRVELREELATVSSKAATRSSRVVGGVIPLLHVIGLQREQLCTIS
jgi:hypothetical protein